MMKNKKRDGDRAEIGVVYARYSAGSHQTEQSIEGQIRECTQYAERCGIKLVHHYIDRKISGTTDNREQFLQMISDAKKHKFDVVVTYKTDRFSRNRYDAAVYKRELQKNGVRIAYAKESIPDGPEGIILESLLEGLAEYYSAELRQKIQRGMIESAHKAKALGPLPLGYKKSPDGKYEIDHETAPIIRTIFEKYCDGERVKNIAQFAYSMGLRSRSGGAVAASRITEMIQNQKYIGIYEAFGVRIENGVPPIVDKKMFYCAQKRLEYNRHHRQVSGGRAKAKVDYLLSGKVYCGHCGEPMVGYSGYGRNLMYHYYACRGKIRHTCKKKTVQKGWLEDFVLETTVKKVLQPEVISKIIEGYIRLSNEGKDVKEQKRRKIKKAITQNENAISNVLSAIADGFASESLKKYLIDLEYQRKQLNIEYNELQDETNITRQQIEFLLLHAQRKGNEDTEEYCKKLIDIFIESVFLFDDKIVITYRLKNENSDPALSVTEFTELEPILEQQLQMMFVCNKIRSIKTAEIE